MEGERVAGRALLAIGRHDRDFAELGRGLDETVETVRENAVVVGAKQLHACLVASRWRQIVRTTRTESLNGRK